MECKGSLQRVPWPRHLRDWLLAFTWSSISARGTPGDPLPRPSLPSTVPQFATRLLLPLPPPIFSLLPLHLSHSRVHIHLFLSSCSR